MPILKNAKKALRRDKRRTIVNLKVKNRMKEAVKEARDTKDLAKLPAAYQAVDRAVKQKLVHKNKAARLKSQLSRLSKPETKPAKTTTSVAKKSTKTVAKKAASKKATPKKTSK